MALFEVGKNNLINYMRSEFPTYNFVDVFQTVPREMKFPTFTISYASIQYDAQVQEYVNNTVPSIGGTLTTYWGQEKGILKFEIVHNNRNARNSFVELMLQKFIVDGSLRINESNYTVMSYRSMETPKEVQLSLWFSAFTLNSYSNLTIDSQVNAMATIEKNLTTY